MLLGYLECCIHTLLLWQFLEEVLKGSLNLLWFSLLFWADYKLGHLKVILACIWPTGSLLSRPNLMHPSIKMTYTAAYHRGGYNSDVAPFL